MIEVEYIKNKAMYKADEDMKNYVCKYAKLYGLTIETALTHNIVTKYRKYLQGENYDIQ